MPTIKATQDFYDVEGKCLRAVGEEWECKDERAAQLAAYGMAEIADAAPAEEPKPKPKRSKKKAE